MFLPHFIGQSFRPGRGAYFYSFSPPRCLWGFSFRFSLPVGQQAKRACTKTTGSKTASQAQILPTLHFLFFLGSGNPFAPWTPANSVAGVEKSTDNAREEASLLSLSPARSLACLPIFGAMCACSRHLMWPGQVVMQQLLQMGATGS